MELRLHWASFYFLFLLPSPHVDFLQGGAGERIFPPPSYAPSPSQEGFRGRAAWQPYWIPSLRQGLPFPGPLCDMEEDNVASRSDGLLPFFVPSLVGSRSVRLSGLVSPVFLRGASDLSYFLWRGLGLSPSGPASRFWPETLVPLHGFAVAGHGNRLRMGRLMASPVVWPAALLCQTMGPLFSFRFICCSFYKKWFLCYLGRTQPDS